MTEETEAFLLGSLRRLLSSFDYREYRLYWSGSSLMIITIRIQEVVLGWQILEVTESALWLGLVAFVYGLPLLLLSPLTGLLADRYRRQKVVLGASLLAAVVSAVLSTLSLIGLASPITILLTSFAIGCAFTLFAPARLALLPNLVPHEQLFSAASLEYASTRLMGFLGPLAAGFLLGAVGIWPTLLIQAFLFVTAGLVFMITGTNIGKPLTAPREGVIRGLQESISFLKKNPSLLGLVILGLFIVPFGMTYTRLTQVFVRDVLKAGPEILGFALALAGLGAAISGLIITTMKTIRYRGRAVLFSSAAFGIGLIALGFTDKLSASLPVLFALGLVSGVFLTISQVTLQTDAPDTLRGRLLSIWGMVWGLLPITSLIAGAAADVWGVTAVFIISGVISLLGCASLTMTSNKLLQL